MRDITREQVDAMLDVLRNFPADGQLRETQNSGGAVTNCILCGFVENLEQKTPCRTCGHPRVTHRYFRITAAGRALLALAEKAA